ncbi:(2,3-dihydroxybenzoyl)adenylate synthase [Gordonia soli]|uniref:Putative 2,3-dihydroxybenzoate-AMP ligase n=1 Tax=Gordonia soli NBRC 108243 TaxID=1223545 RepID=M0QQW5_9ACTN|nr:AMP-binding protein [Gordonia soli]GAC70661.1 putative 2,3-dihydroxybenzoate-AMP ligase [Gordonia soli NBRC 108243]
MTTSGTQSTDIRTGDSIRSKIPDWPADFAAKYRELGLWEGLTFSARLDGWARDFGSSTAIVDGDKRITYAELAERATDLAHGLRELGVRAGDAVLLQLPNSAEFIIGWFALQRLGAVPVHTQPGHRQAEVGHLAGATGATVYITTDVFNRFDHRDLAKQIIDSTPSLRSVVIAGDLGDHAADDRFTEFSSLYRPGSGPIEDVANPGDIALLLLSGGTTGMPKLIGRTHDDYGYNSRAAGERSRLDADSVYLAVLPIAFNYTWNCPGILATFRVGGKVVLARTQDPSVVFELIEQEGVTMTAINPQLAPVWLDEREFTDNDLSSLRIIEIGSARLSDHEARRIIDEFDATLQQILGMSEGLFCATYLDDDPELLATAQGVPVSPYDEIRVVDSDGNEVPNGEVGELTVRGPYTLRGYFDAPEHNVKSFTDDGFYCTGDLVRRLDTGHLIVSGRIKDQINRGGEKIAATEVEGALLKHPLIRSVALIGEPDPTLGERTVAFVVVEPGAEEPPTRRDLANFLESEAGLALYKAPDIVNIIDEMPLTPLGKMDKNVLRQQLAPA